MTAQKKPDIDSATATKAIEEPKSELLIEQEKIEKEILIERMKMSIDKANADIRDRNIKLKEHELNRMNLQRVIDEKTQFIRNQEVKISDIQKGG